MKRLAFTLCFFASTSLAQEPAAFDAAAATAQVNERMDMLRGCYDAAVRDAGARNARIELVVRIQPDGSVAQAVASGVNFGGIVGCMEGVARTWTFATSATGGEVRVPLEFSPEAGAEAGEASARPTETNCTDRNDDDGDGLADCADADCFDNEVCRAGGGDERNDERCSDWVDNDGDGATDCEDADCQGPGVSVCRGSAETDHSGRIQPGIEDEEELPGLSGDMSVEDLIGRGSDIDGERNDYLCSDGVDNDNDGRTDCQDFGCRFDPQVTVCASSPGFRFSVVAGVSASYDLQAGLIDRDDSVTAADVNFSRLQARVLGPIPFINNSFFLLSMRLEKSIRLTFAHFQIPLGSRGHSVALNSGSGSLSSGLIISTSKQALLDPPFYLFNAFEQGNGANLEFSGPLIPSSKLMYRVFAAGGSGRFNGNVGGRFFPDDNENFTYTAGAQLQVNAIGFFNRFDSRFLYTKVPLTLGFLVGGKYDQRATERFPAANFQANFRYGIVQLTVEDYFKYVLDFGGSIQNAFNVALSLLLWPRHLMLAADFGMYMAQPFDELTDLAADAGQAQPEEQWQYRVALHWFWYRNIGLLSLLYSETHTDENIGRALNPEFQEVIEREIRLEAQFRF